MATYTPGDNEDHVVKTTEFDKDIDLTVFTDKFKEIRDALKDLPDLKTVPDQESMDHWNATIYDEGQTYKTILDAQAVELYQEATAIRDAGLLPAKYEDEYQQLKDYVEGL